jgi:hypothetical protein
MDAQFLQALIGYLEQNPPKSKGVYKDTVSARITSQKSQ